MTKNGFGLGAFGRQSDLNSVTDAVRSVINQSKPQIELHPDVTPEHISAAANDVRQNAVTLEDRNRIINNHARSVGGMESTTQNAAAFSTEVLRDLNKR
tara:strand:+ start:192 stop:488 length:297 start_codon:yes stop_codon:yes gene_type:complete